jgi:hypothetical protein
MRFANTGGPGVKGGSCQKTRRAERPSRSSGYLCHDDAGGDGEDEDTGDFPPPPISYSRCRRWDSPIRRQHEHSPPPPTSTCSSLARSYAYQSRPSPPLRSIVRIVEASWAEAAHSPSRRFSLALSRPYQLAICTCLLSRCPLLLPPSYRVFTYTHHPVSYTYLNIYLLSPTRVCYLFNGFSAIFH